MSPPLFFAFHGGSPRYFPKQVFPQPFSAAVVPLLQTRVNFLLKHLQFTGLSHLSVPSLLLTWVLILDEPVTKCMCLVPTFPNLKLLKLVGLLLLVQLLHFPASTCYRAGALDVAVSVPRDFAVKHSLSQNL